MFRVYDITTVLDQDCAAHNRNGFTYCLSVIRDGGKSKERGVVLHVGSFRKVRLLIFDLYEYEKQTKKKIIS
jgi:hypothetical protein